MLIVADKYQTGFDEPLLHTMYVDKRLSGIKAVQTLSRLNRTYPGKEDTFVLDFVNNIDEIRESFQPYFEQTVIAQESDPNLLFDLKTKLEGAQIYWQSEVESFCKVFFKPKQQQLPKDLAQLYGYLQPALDRFAHVFCDEVHHFQPPFHRGFFIACPNGKRCSLLFALMSRVFRCVRLSAILVCRVAWLQDWLQKRDAD